MVHLHCRVRTRVRTGIQIRNLIATLYYASHVHITQTRTRTPTPYLCTGQESEPVFGNVNEPLTDGQQRVFGGTGTRNLVLQFEISQSLSLLQYHAEVTPHGKYIRINQSH